MPIDNVPTADDLVRRQLARVSQRKGDSKIWISPEGHALMGEALRANAREDLEKGTWHGITGKHTERPAR